MLSTSPFLSSKRAWLRSETEMKKRRSVICGSVEGGEFDCSSRPFAFASCETGSPYRTEPHNLLKPRPPDLFDTV